MKVLGRQGIPTVLGLQNELYSDRPSANNYLGNGAPEYRSGIFRPMNKYAQSVVGRYATWAMLSLAAAGAALTTSACSENINPCNREETISNPIAPASAGCPQPVPTPQPPPQIDQCPNIDGLQGQIPDGMIKDSNGNCIEVAQVSGFAKRILQNDGGGSTVAFGDKDSDRFQVNAEGNYSGTLKPGSYAVSVTGDHQSFTMSRVTLNPGQSTLSFWLMDYDSDSGPFEFNKSEFEDWYRGGAPLKRWDADFTLRIYDGSPWTEGRIFNFSSNQKATFQEIMAEIDAGYQEVVTRMMQGRLRRISMTIKHEPGVYNPAAEAPGFFDVYAVLNNNTTDKLALTAVNNGVIITNGWTQVDVNKIGDLRVLQRVARHEAGHMSGVRTEGSGNTIMGASRVITIRDSNNGTVAYSLPVGSRDNGTIATMKLSPKKSSTSESIPQSPTSDTGVPYIPEPKVPEIETPAEPLIPDQILGPESGRRRERPIQ